MKKAFLKLLLVPAICTALTACGDVESTYSNISNSSNDSGETTSETTSVGDVSYPAGIVPATNKDLAVIDILNSYKEGNKLEDAFSSGFSVETTSNVKFDLETEDKIKETNDITFSTDFVNTSLVNSYVGEDESSLYVESSIVGDVSVTDYYDTNEDGEGESVYVQEGLNTDFDLVGKAEISDATYVKASGKLPSENFQDVESMTAETPEELAERSNFLFQGYSTEYGYESYFTMIAGLLSGTEEPAEMKVNAEDEEDLPILDLNDDETYLGVYNFLTGRDENGYIKTTIDLNSDGTITLDFELDLNQINLFGAYGGEALLSALGGAIGVDMKDYVDEITMFIGSHDKAFEVSLTLDKEYLPSSFGININLDDTVIEMSKGLEEADEVGEMNYIITLNEAEVKFESDFVFGSEVEKLGFSDEEKEEIEKNGEDITGFIDEGYANLVDALVGQK